MVLNDVFDIEVDRQERPNRPCPPDKSRSVVQGAIGWTLLVCGVLLAGLSGVLGSVPMIESVGVVERSALS